MGLGRRSACGTRALRLMATVVVSPFDVANFPEGGGHFWVYMQYAQGLRRLGCDVYWLEQFRPGRDKSADALAVAKFIKRIERTGQGENNILYKFVGGQDAPLNYVRES